MVDLILMALAMALTVCFVFFIAYLIDLNSVYPDEQEMENREKVRRENPKNVYLILVALAITILNILLMQLAPNKPIPGSGLENIYDAISGLAFFLLFRRIFFGEKVGFKRTSRGKIFSFSNICKYLCLALSAIF